MSYATIVFAALVLIWALRRVMTTTPAGETHLQARRVEPSPDGLDLYVSIPIIRDPRKDPMLHIIIRAGRREVWFVPTPTGLEQRYPLPETFIVEELWQQLEAETKKRPGVELHA